MRYASLVVLGALGGCSDPATGNPAVLWLWPENGEQNVKLEGQPPSGPF
jgi:hypothetical protein